MVLNFFLNNIQTLLWPRLQVSVQILFRATGHACQVMLYISNSKKNMVWGKAYYLRRNCNLSPTVYTFICQKQLCQYKNVFFLTEKTIARSPHQIQKRLILHCLLYNIVWLWFVGLRIACCSSHIGSWVLYITHMFRFFRSRESFLSGTLKGSTDIRL